MQVRVPERCFFWCVSAHMYLCAWHLGQPLGTACVCCCACMLLRACSWHNRFLQPGFLPCFLCCDGVPSRLQAMCLLIYDLASLWSGTLLDFIKSPGKGRGDFSVFSGGAGSLQPAVTPLSSAVSSTCRTPSHLTFVASRQTTRLFSLHYFVDGNSCRA